MHTQINEKYFSLLLRRPLRALEALACPRLKFLPTRPQQARNLLVALAMFFSYQRFALWWRRKHVGAAPQRKQRIHKRRELAEQHTTTRANFLSDLRLPLTILHLVSLQRKRLPKKLFGFRVRAKINHARIVLGSKFGTADLAKQYASFVLRTAVPTRASHEKLISRIGIVFCFRAILNNKTRRRGYDADIPNAEPAQARNVGRTQQRALSNLQRMSVGVA